MGKGWVSFIMNLEEYVLAIRQHREYGRLKEWEMIEEEQQKILDDLYILHYNRRLKKLLIIMPVFISMMLILYRWLKLIGLL